MWQITDMPTQRGSGDDFVGWLCISKAGIHVKVQIGGANVTQEDAFLIIQQFAGIITPGGLMSSLLPSQNGNSPDHFREVTEMVLLQERK